MKFVVKNGKQVGPEITTKVVALLEKQCQHIVPRCKVSDDGEQTTYEVPNDTPVAVALEMLCLMHLDSGDCFRVEELPEIEIRFPKISAED